MEDVPLPDHTACRAACLAVLVLITVVAVACLAAVSLRHGRAGEVTVQAQR